MSIFPVGYLNSHKDDAYYYNIIIINYYINILIINNLIDLDSYDRLFSWWFRLSIKIENGTPKWWSFLTCGHNSKVVVNSGLTVCVINQIFFLIFRTELTFPRRRTSRRGTWAMTSGPVKSSRTFQNLSFSISTQKSTK